MADSKFILMDILVGIVFVSMINMVFNINGLLFGLEFIGLMMLGFFTFISMIAILNQARWGYKFLFFIFLILILDILSIFYFKGRQEFFLTSILFSSFGLILSVFSIDNKETEEEAETPAEPQVKKEFSPGKFVASKTGKKYHTPKCDWAKRIKKSNQVWFDSEEEAKKKGYKKDTCLNDKIYKNF